MTVQVRTYVWIHDGVVQNIILWDGNSDPSTGGIDIPEGHAIIPLLDGQLPNIGLGASLGSDGVWSYEQPAPPPPPSQQQIEAANTAVRNQLLASAGLAIAPLQDAVDLGEANAAETALLAKWKQFRVAVNRVDLTAASPVWPQAPAPLNYIRSEQTS